jgi:hypothetical protein
VTYDSRGNAQWDLGMSTTEIRKLSRTAMLRKLDSSGLSIADDPPAGDAEKPGAAKAGATTPAADPAKPSRVEGFNPYDRPLLPKRPRR